MAGPWGFQPQSQRSERCVLCDLNDRPKTWYGYEESNPNLNVRSVLSYPLNDTRKKMAGRPGLEPGTSAFRSRRAARCASGCVEGGERIERPKPASKADGLPLTEPPSKWGDRRELNSRGWSHNPSPEPLGHGHIWRLRERSNLRVRLFRPVLVHLSYAGELGGDGENRTLIGWVQTSSPPVERRPRGCGGGNRTHLVAAYETAVRSSSSSPHQKSGRPSRNRTRDLPCIRRMHSLPCSRALEPRARNRTGFSALQERRIASNACGAQTLEPKGGFEPPSERYEGSVFPTKLLRPWSG